GIKGSYVGKLQLKDKKLPESYTLVMEGKGASGFVHSTARIQLVEKDQETELHCEADAQVGGPIAAIGSRLIEAAAKKMTDDFLKNSTGFCLPRQGFADKPIRTCSEIGYWTIEGHRF